MYWKSQRVQQTLYTLLSPPSDLIKRIFLSFPSSFMCLWCFCSWCRCNYLFHSPLFWMQSHSGWMSIQTEITRFSRSGISNEAASESLPQEYFLRGNFGACFAEWCKGKSDLGGYLTLRSNLISVSPLFKIPGQQEPTKSPWKICKMKMEGFKIWESRIGSDGALELGRVNSSSVFIFVLNFVFSQVSS